MKSSFLKALMSCINKNHHEFHCVLATVERVQTHAGEDKLRAVAARIANGAMVTGDDLRPSAILKEQRDNIANSVQDLLSKWAEQVYNDDGKKLVLLLDEFDTLVGEPLLSVLGELRSNYHLRPDHYPSSIVLCGMRDLRDYKMDDGSKVLGTSSPFNITDRSIRTTPFTPEQVASLYQQHTKATGQIFEPEALEEVMFWTGGQPWLVNRFGRELCFESLPSKDPSVVTRALVKQAANLLAVSKETHLDTISTLLKEPRLRDVVAPIIVGSDATGPEADLSYARDLGLVSFSEPLEFTNRLYANVIPRILADVTPLPEKGFVGERSLYVQNGRMNIEAVLVRFCGLLRQHGTAMQDVTLYEELPHLQLMHIAF
jgi:hypothetical protein